MWQIYDLFSKLKSIKEIFKNSVHHKSINRGQYVLFLRKNDLMLPFLVWLAIEMVEITIWVDYQLRTSALPPSVYTPSIYFTSPSPHTHTYTPPRNPITIFFHDRRLSPSSNYDVPSPIYLLAKSILSVSS